MTKSSVVTVGRQIQQPGGFKAFVPEKIPSRKNFLSAIPSLLNYYPKPTSLLEGPGRPYQKTFRI